MSQTEKQIKHLLIIETRQLLKFINNNLQFLSVDEIHQLKASLGKTKIGPKVEEETQESAE
jgi:hypothetical protein